jgi:hypothetical protein
VTIETFPGLRLVSDSFQRDYVFGATRTDVFNLDVDAPGKTWRLSSDTPWAVVPAGTRTGSATVPVTLNVSAIYPFNATIARVTVTNVADPDDKRTADVSVRVESPQFNVTPDSLTLGGPTGIDPLSATATLTLNTGPINHPWTAELLQVPVAGHLVPTASGIVGGNSPAVFTLTGSEATLPAGTSTGSVRFTADIFGRLYSRTIPLVVNRQSQRLFPRADGVAFSSFPGGGMLSRQVRIDESYGRPGVPWTASASTPWLDVSPASGVTGDTLTITAAPGTLAADQFHSATVTLTSSNPRVERSEIIRVGLWKGSTDPVAHAVPFATIERDVVANPVEPYVYLLGGDAVIRVFHVHTGASVATFSPPVSDHGALAIASDGRRLYVSDPDRHRTLELDAVTGAWLREFLSPADSARLSPGSGPQMLVSRLNGRPVLYPPFSGGRDPVLPIDLESGQPLQGYDERGSRYDSAYLSSFHRSQRASADGEFHYRADDSLIETRHVRFSTLRGPSFIYVSGQSFRRALNRDFCVAADETVLHTSSSGIQVALKNLEPSAFAPLTVPSTLGSLACGWNGRVYAVLGPASDTAPNLAVFDGRTAVGTIRLGPIASQIFSRPHLSGDGKRILWTDFLAGVTSLRIDAAP